MKNPKQYRQQHLEAMRKAGREYMYRVRHGLPHKIGPRKKKLVSYKKVRIENKDKMYVDYFIDDLRRNHKNPILYKSQLGNRLKEEIQYYEKHL